MILLMRFYAVIRRLMTLTNPRLSFVFFLFKALLVLKKIPSLPWAPLPIKGGGDESFLENINLGKR